MNGQPSGAIFDRFVVGDYRKGAGDATDLIEGRLQLVDDFPAAEFCGDEEILPVDRLGLVLEGGADKLLCAIDYEKRHIGVSSPCHVVI